MDNMELVTYKPGEIIEYPPGSGSRVKVCENGAGWSYDTGMIAHGPGTFAPDPNSITPQTSQEYHRIRKERAIERAMVGAGKAVPAKGADGWDAWEEINRVQARIAMTEKFGRASTEAAKFVGHATQLLPDRSRQANSASDGHNITVTIPPAAVAALVDAARRVNNSRVDGG